MSTHLASPSKTLSVSCVTFNSDSNVLSDTLKSLSASCDVAIQAGVISFVDLYIIDNGPDARNLSILIQLKNELTSYFSRINLITGHGNVGYGRGHNLSIMEVDSDYHLILNPDVVVALENINYATTYMNEQPQVALLVPDAFGANGERQYLAKRNPSFFILLARALNHPLLNKWMKIQLDQYEYRDIIPAIEPIEIELASGCYMLFRTSILKQVNGFNASFFMYFEDFELTRRIRKLALVKHHPKLIITHYGGGAFQKGLKHIIYFMCSYLRFRFMVNFKDNK